MKPVRLILVLITFLFFSVIVESVLANETYGYVTQWGSIGTGNGQFFMPNGIAVDASGNVFVADSGNNRIQEFDSDGNYQSQFGGR